MKNLTINKVGVLSAAKISGVLGLVIGLIVGVMYALIFLVMGAAVMERDGGEGAAFMGMGIGVACIAPIFYAFVSFVAGALYAFAFNVCVRVTGGLEIEVAES